MAPLITMLLKNGLGLAANAVLAKGQEWVEQKAGVKLGEQLSVDGLTQVRQFELENEAELLRLRAEDNRLDLEFLKTEVEEKDSARKRDQAFLAAGTRNYRADLMFLLAVLVIIGLVWMVWKDPSINEYVKGIVTLVLGRFMGYLDNIYNFEFGTTRSSRKKDDTIEHLSKGGQ